VQRISSDGLTPPRTCNSSVTVAYTGRSGADTTAEPRTTSPFPAPAPTLPHSQCKCSLTRRSTTWTSTA
jgi:hypothetical protein